MSARIAILAVLVFALAAWTHPAENVIRPADNLETAKTPGDVSQLATKHMEIGRSYLRKGSYAAALNRFKLVVTGFPTSQHVEEARREARGALKALGVEPAEDSWIASR